MTSEPKKGVQVTTSKQPAEDAGKYISDLLAVHVDKQILLLVGGGSCMDVVDLISPEFIDSNITVTVTDDRFTEEIERNNFAIMQSTEFYNNLIQVDAFCINTQLFGSDTVEIYRDRFEKNIKDWKKDFPEGIIIALFGMGADGHVAGILPGVYEEGEFDKKFDGESYVADVDAEGLNDEPLRITTTFPFMRMVDYPLFYIIGEAKKPALLRALADEGTLFETPARIVKEMKNPEIFTDIALN